MKPSQVNFYGVKHGVFYLIVFTFVYYGNLVPSILIKSVNSFKFMLFLSSVLCNFVAYFLVILAFWFNLSLLYLPLIAVLSIFLKAYEDFVEPQLE